MGKEYQCAICGKKSSQKSHHEAHLLSEGHKNKRQIKDCILTLVKDEKLRKQLGKQGRERVLDEFEQNYVTKEFVNYIKIKINTLKKISIISSNLETRFIILAKLGFNKY